MTDMTDILGNDFQKIKKYKRIFDPPDPSCCHAVISRDIVLELQTKVSPDPVILSARNLVYR